MKSFFQNNSIEMYSRHNDGKALVAEIFIRTLKNRIQYMTSISKKLYIDKLNKIVNKYNNTYYRTIRIKRVHVNPNIYIDFNKENNKAGPKFKVSNHVRILKYQNYFAKGYVPNWSKEFRVEKVINRRGDKVYVKWKHHNIYFNNWTNKKDII